MLPEALMMNLSSSGLKIALSRIIPTRFSKCPIDKPVFYSYAKATDQVPKPTGMGPREDLRVLL